MNLEQLHDMLHKIKYLSILVVGDFFLDKYLIIDPRLNEESLETGLDAYQVIDKRLSPGAAGTLTNNLQALGVGKIHALGFFGDDGEGYELIKALKSNKVSIDAMIKTRCRYTPTYTKPMIKEKKTLRELNRLDIKNRAPLPSDIEESIISKLEYFSDKVDAIMVLDQVTETNCGVITEKVREKLAQIGGRSNSPVIYCDSRANTILFDNIIVKCNQYELLKAFGVDADKNYDDNEIIYYGKKLFEKNKRPVFITIGKRGQFVIDETGASHVPEVYAKGPFDICGAGDATSSGIVTALCCGSNNRDAAFMGNLVASITIQQLGTTGTATASQVISRFVETSR